MSEREMNELFPSIEPYDSGYLKVSSTHTIYYEQSGNKTGKPVVYLHGGKYTSAKNKDQVGVLLQMTEDTLILKYIELYYLINEERAKVHRLHVW